MSANQIYEFGPFRLDPVERRLLRRGEPVPLPPKVFDTLLVLVENSGRLVRKDDLMKRVWPDAFVEEVNLAQNVSAIRRVLRDGNDGAEYIETVAKGGYRFAVPARLVGHDLPPDETSRAVASAESAPPLQPPVGRRLSARLVIAILAVGLVAAAALFLFRKNPVSAGAQRATSPAIRSIAVLPFVNLSSDPEQEYFSDGMTDELITDLARGPLLVISHTSVERYKRAHQPLPQIARELGVDAIVEGSVMRSGDRVRITAQLIDTRTDRHLWAESYERPLVDVLALQDDVARHIAGEVGVKLAGVTANPASAPQANPAAHEAFLKGTFFWGRLNCKSFDTALGYFQQAAAHDPQFVPARVGLAQTYFTLGDWGCRPQDEAFVASEAAARAAIAMDPHNGAAHSWLGKIYFFRDWNWQDAEREFTRAGELEPNDPANHLTYSVFLVAMGRQPEAFAELAKAHALDPTSELTNVIEGYVFYLAHRYDDAVAQEKKALDLYPSSSTARFWLAAAYERKGMDAAAIAAYIESKEVDGAAAEQIARDRAAAQRAGLRGYWQQQLQYGTAKSDTCWSAMIYGHLGQRNEALDALSRGFRRHCRGLNVLNVDPIYDSLHNDPRFQSLLRQLHL